MKIHFDMGFIYMLNTAVTMYEQRDVADLSNTYDTIVRRCWRTISDLKESKILSQIGIHTVMSCYKSFKLAQNLKFKYDDEPYK